MFNRARRLAVLAIGSLALTLAAVLAPVSAASAADATPCGYADAAGGGKYPGSICWFDFSSYDETAASTSAGQDLSYMLGAYRVTFNVHRSTIPGWSSRSVVPSATGPAFPLGGPGYYQGIPGEPFLYASSGQSYGAVQIEIRNFAVTLNGSPVAGYDLITAAPETADAPVGVLGEWLNFTSDAPLTMIDSLPVQTGGGGCTVPAAGAGSTNVWCNPANAGSTSVYGPIFAAPSATRITGALYMSSRGEREALAFGIRTARVTFSKEVASRIDPTDSFDLAVTAGDSVLGSASTGSAGAATTGAVTVIPSQPIQLSETMAAGSLSALSYYGAAWSCTNAQTTSSTTLPAGGAASAILNLVAGDDVACELVNTALTPAISLTKSASHSTAGVNDTVTYSYVVTNTGQVPLDNATIIEETFSGAGDLSAVTCPDEVIAPTESVTCTATYVVTQADIDASSITNTATAVATVAGGALQTTSTPATALITTGGESKLTLLKTANLAQGNIGDTVTYTLTATNEGALTIFDVQIADTDFTGAHALATLSCNQAAPATLAPGESLVCTTSYVLTPEDPRTITNSAEASGHTLDGTDITASADKVAVSVDVPKSTPGGSLAITGGNANTAIPIAGVGGVLLLVGAGSLLLIRYRRSR